MTKLMEIELVITDIDTDIVSDIDKILDYYKSDTITDDNATNETNDDEIL